MTQQLTGGSLDVALSVGITDPIRAIEKGAPLALVRVIGNSPPYVLIGKPGLKSIADLKGKIISVGAVNDITTVFFEKMAAANGLKKGDYEIISAGVAAARFAALKAGVVDAAIVLPPLNFQANKAGFVTLGFAADYVKDIPFTGMAMHRRWAGANMSAAKRVLAATDKSIAWFADPAHRGEAVELLVKVGAFEQGGCREQLRLPAPDRIFRADQQSLARKIAQSGRDGAAGRNRRRGLRHREAWRCRG